MVTYLQEVIDKVRRQHTTELFDYLNHNKKQKLI
jgi:hypothetical protein